MQRALEGCHILKPRSFCDFVAGDQYKLGSPCQEEFPASS